MRHLHLLAAMGLLCTAPGFVGAGQGNDHGTERSSRACSTRTLAGKWMFATDVGQQQIFPGGDITAIGVFRLDRTGTLTDGIFDANVYEWRFLPGVTFTGSLVVNPNCTGTLTFVTSAGTTRIDSVVVLGPNRIRGMSQDTTNLWTYTMERL